jgi:hypothetical protein
MKSEGIATVYLKRDKSVNVLVNGIIALALHARTHTPQSIHFSESIYAFLFLILIASTGQTLRQAISPLHLDGSKYIEWFVVPLCMFSINVYLKADVCTY